MLLCLTNASFLTHMRRRNLRYANRYLVLIDFEYLKLFIFWIFNHPHSLSYTSTSHAPLFTFLFLLPKLSHPPYFFPVLIKQRLLPITQPLCILPHSLALYLLHINFLHYITFIFLPPFQLLSSTLLFRGAHQSTPFTNRSTTLQSYT